MEPFIQAAPDIDVEEIMAAIGRKIQEKKDAGLLKQRDIDEIAEMELQPLPDFQEIPHVYEPILYPGFAENMAPAPPLPETIDESGFAKGALKKVRKLLFPWIRFMTRPLYVELKTGINNLQNDLHNLQKKTLITLQSSEYIRLLHNTAHNLIVEIAKLKTEEELLKTRMRVIEDKIEFLENRQRALEKNSPAP